MLWIRGLTALVSRSGLAREIDVAIILRPLGFTLHVFVEIKYSSRELMVSDIEAIGAKFEDLGAAKGIIVCNSGFTADAITRAKSMGIGLAHPGRPRRGRHRRFRRDHRLGLDAIVSDAEASTSQRFDERIMRPLGPDASRRRRPDFLRLDGVGRLEDRQ